MIEVAGRLGDIVEDLDWAIQLALAGGPRGVACDLTGVLHGVEPSTLAALAAAGRHVRDWGGAPLAFASPDPRVLEALRVHPLGAELILTKSLLFALYAVLRIPAPAVKGIRLRSQPTAPRLARQFVSSTLQDWQVPTAFPLACLVASELVTRSTLYDSTGDDIDLTVAWNLQSLRLAVADHTPDMRHRQHEGPDREERGLATVAGVSRAHGVLPAADGGKVVWAVLDRPEHDPSTYLR